LDIRPAAPAAGTGLEYESASVQVGTHHPLAIGVDPITNRVYVPLSSEKGEVVVINGSSDRLAASVFAGNNSDAVGFDPLNGRVYVANENSENVTVLNGSTGARIGSVSVGSDPIAVQYNPGDGDIYVANDLSSNVSVISPQTSRVLASVSVGDNPIAFTVDGTRGEVLLACEEDVELINRTTHAVDYTFTAGIYPDALAFDPAERIMLVANYNSNTVSIINLSSLTVAATVPVGVAPSGLAYDNSDGYAYVANQGSENVSVIAPMERKVVATVPAGLAPHGIAFDPVNGCVYIENVDTYNVTVITDHRPAINLSAAPGDTDVGLSVNVSAITSGGLPPLEPSFDFGDGTPVLAGSNSVRHSYGSSGNYTLNATATDADGVVGYNATVVSVHPLPITLAPVPSSASRDVGQEVRFTTTATLGIPPYVRYGWSGLPPGCTNLTSPLVDCHLTLPGNYTVRAMVNDSVGGQSVPSPPVPFTVFSLPDEPALTANRTNADVGQSVGFSGVGSGGSGKFGEYTWYGLPTPRCEDLNSSTPTCTFATPGSYLVTASAVDSNGVESPRSASITVNISALPMVRIEVSRPTADLHQGVNFTAYATGGFGIYSYAWTGLPDLGCSGQAGAEVSCTVELDSTLSVGVDVVDANGGSSGPSFPATLTVYSDPVLSPLVISPTQVHAGDRVLINGSAHGGYGTLHYNWSGLPSGCVVEGSLATCYPGQPGTYRIHLTVVDDDGYAVHTAVSTLTVLEKPGGITLVPGVPPLESYGLVGAVVAVAVAAAVILSRRGKKV
jgi:YVTN family beta-propeller protein